MPPITVKVTKLRDDAILPTKVYKDDAGFDLYAVEDVYIDAFDVAIVPTGIAMAIPEGYFGKIFDRSGNASKKKIHVLAGVIDAGYRGEIGVVIHNTNPEPITIQKGAKIAQIILLKLPEIQMEVVSKLDESARGNKGFGSSGTV